MIGRPIFTAEWPRPHKGGFVYRVRSYTSLGRAIRSCDLSRAYSAGVCTSVPRFASPVNLSLQMGFWLCVGTARLADQSDYGPITSRHELLFRTYILALIYAICEHMRQVAHRANTLSDVAAEVGGPGKYKIISLHRPLSVVIAALGSIYSERASARLGSDWALYIRAYPAIARSNVHLRARSGQPMMPTQTQLPACKRGEAR